MACDLSDCNLRVSDRRWSCTSSQPCGDGEVISNFFDGSNFDTHDDVHAGNRRAPEDYRFLQDPWRR